MITPTLSDLRRYAISRSLFRPTTLPKAIAKLGFVQADSSALSHGAHELTVRHRSPITVPVTARRTRCWTSCASAGWAIRAMQMWWHAARKVDCDTGALLP